MKRQFDDVRLMNFPMLLCALALLLLTDAPLWIRAGEIRPALGLTSTAVACAAFAELILLRRSLPVQNVVACALVIGVASVVHTLLVEAPRSFSFWLSPAVWTAVILSSRGTASFCLEKFRGTRFYGATLLGLSWGLSMIAYAALRQVLVPLSPHFSAAHLTLAAVLIVVVLLLLAVWMMDKRGLPPPKKWPSFLVWMFLVAYSAAAGFSQRTAPPRTGLPIQVSAPVSLVSQQPRISQFNFSIQVP